MKTKTDNKLTYVSPTFEINKISLEGAITAASPIQSVELKDWVQDDPNDLNSSADIWLNF
jgi:hypothetical protein